MRIETLHHWEFSRGAINSCLLSPEYMMSANSTFRSHPGCYSDMSANISWNDPNSKSGHSIMKIKWDKVWLVWERTVYLIASLLPQTSQFYIRVPGTHELFIEDVLQYFIFNNKQRYRQYVYISCYWHTTDVTPPSSTTSVLYVESEIRIAYNLYTHSELYARLNSTKYNHTSVSSHFC